MSSFFYYGNRDTFTVGERVRNLNRARSAVIIAILPPPYSHCVRVKDKNGIEYTWLNSELMKDCAPDEAP